MGDATTPPPPVDAGPGPAPFAPGELDPPSHGGTITFEGVGATGWYPSRRDPTVGPCDAYQTNACCLARHDVTSGALAPWDTELILSLRGPLRVKQLAVYQPSAGDGYALVSAWDERAPAGAGVAFRGNGAEKTGFPGSVGTECIVDVSSATPFACGAGSTPYCPPVSGGGALHLGWPGSKLLVLLASMPHAGEVSGGCSKDTTGNWYDAPWIGLSLGELIRAGAFSGCHCYAKDPSKGALGDGCGQFNVFEVVNDNNSYRNLEVFSTNLVGYGGYVGEGPCGGACDAARFPSEADLIDKTTSAEATRGAVVAGGKGPGAAFRRPAKGYRYFLIALDMATRTVQLAVVHPASVPPALTPLLPGLPSTVGASVIRELLALRLPH